MNAAVLLPPEVETLVLQLTPKGPKHEIRAVAHKGAAWFVAKDAAAAIGLRVDNALRYVQDNEQDRAPVRTAGGLQQVAVVNEGGLFRMLMRSGKPEARQFQELVQSDLLPKLRGKGFYDAAHQMPVPAPIKATGQDLVTMPQEDGQGSHEEGLTAPSDAIEQLQQVVQMVGDVAAHAGSDTPPPEDLTKLLYSVLAGHARRLRVNKRAGKKALKELGEGAA